MSVPALAAGNPARSLDELMACVAADHRDESVHLFGLFFAQPTSTIAKRVIIPKLPDWHQRSADHIHFYFAGYAREEPPEPELQSYPVRFETGKTWWYSPVLYDQFRADIQKQSNWKWSGGCDLLLCNTFTHKGKPSPNFGEAIPFQLDKMETDRTIISIEMFFESIVQFAEKYDGRDPINAFSDTQAKLIVGSALKRLLLSILLPGKLKQDYKKAEHFAVQDLSLSRWRN